MIIRNNQSGFTLVELLVAMAIAALLLAAMVMAFTGQSRSYNTQQEISSLQEDMWAALQLISRDIRMAGYDPSGSGNFGILSATAAQFQATQDINSNGVIDAGETILYTLTGTSLTRDIGGGPQPVIDNITQLAFEYQTITKNGTLPWLWNWNHWIVNPVPATLANVRVVKICMQGSTPRQTSTATDTSSFNPPFISFAPNWTPSALTRGKFQFRTMCVEVQCRNFID